jgi:hypothetical protein
MQAVGQKLARPIHEPVVRGMHVGQASGIVASFSPLLELAFWNALEVGGMRLVGASRPRGSWSGGLQGDGDSADQRGLRTGGGEGQPDARDGFDDAGPELEELEPEGGELGAGEAMGLGHRIAQREINQ